MSLVTATEHTEPDGDDTLCRSIGTWFEPSSRRPLEVKPLMAALAGRNVVLLGESHTSAEHHRWQLQVLAGLHALRPNLVVGFEMFPRSAQAALDAWSDNRLSEQDFLTESRWGQVWGYDPKLYLPLLHFVRQNRLLAVAMNVDRQLVSRVGRDGWSAVPAEDREGLSDPAPASDGYRASLAKVYATKLTREGPNGDAAAADPPSEAPSVGDILERDDFSRFVEAQLTWDRAMAEAVAAARNNDPQALVVGILGSGHVAHGHGVPHQLAALGVSEVETLLPVETGSACEGLAPDMADAAFVVASETMVDAPPAKPRLGVMIDQADGGVRVMGVVDGSVAAATGLMTGDVIVSAAGFPVERTTDLIEIVQRQAPGTLLPLEITRDGETASYLATFPTTFE